MRVVLCLGLFQEGIAFSFRYGIDIMTEMGLGKRNMRAGYANMFLSKVFAETVASVNGVTVELYNTDGSQGAARGAGVGCGLYKSFDEAFDGLKVVKTIEPDNSKFSLYEDAYKNWMTELNKILF